MTCDFSEFYSRRRDLIVTQYRESPNLLALMQIYNASLQEVGEAVCQINFDIDTSIGDQLTVIGKVLGWPRTHCAGTRKKTFGFCGDNCIGRTYNIGGFCDDWVCGEQFQLTAGEYEFTDDELYRKFLKSMVLRNDNDYSRTTLIEALKLLFGDGAGILKQTPGHVDVFTGRPLDPLEYEVAHLYHAVLPVAPGVSLGLYETSGGAPFGFGVGWGGFCDGSFPTLLHTQGN